MDTDPTAAPAPVTLGESSKYWLKLGFISFGGPADEAPTLRHPADGPVGAVSAAMRRQAQRANARQGLAAPPLRATARIAAKAAPTRLANANK
jgi:hypothetical protein